MNTKNKQLWTIGHSNHTLEDFLAMLKFFNITLLVDVRSYPGSNYVPHFNKENLEQSLPENNIEYLHLKRLGGRRKGKADSNNAIWRNKSFRAYADYMETESFKMGIDELEKEATKKRTAIMCSEAVWWRCHRSMIADYMKAHGWNVKHIMDKDKEDKHPYTSPASVVQGELVYGVE